MKVNATVIGILLIVLGALSFGYDRITYTTRDKVAQVGDIQVTANTEKTIAVPTVVGGAAVVAGIALVVIGFSRNMKK